MPPRIIPGRVPIAVWAREIPDGALELLERVARQPWAAVRVAGMPDLHVARGVAVGTVFGADDAVVPSALGGDLGCGVRAVRLPFSAAALGPRELREVVRRWGERIPVGDATRRRDPPEPPAALAAPLSTRALERARDRLVERHLGTLGGGNHFVELDRDPEGDLWVLVHSGSRGLGGAIGEHHAKVATALGGGELPALRASSPEGKACLDDVGWALAFARANREALMREALQVLTSFTGASPEEEPLDVHHNFVASEEHDGREVWVHRKGAIAAPEGARAVIPGSMGTASYVVEGLGEPLSLRSGSHGAGRVMTRREARERIDRRRFRASMRRVAYDPEREQMLIEEAPEAYRDIVEVLEDEAELIRPLRRLEPLAVLKG